jgi:ribosomal silencing factor RsfS
MSVLEQTTAKQLTDYKTKAVERMDNAAGQVTGHWKNMMIVVCERDLAHLEAILAEIIIRATKDGSTFSGKNKKTVARWVGVYEVVTQFDLFGEKNSYINDVCRPLKDLRIEIEEWCNNESIVEKLGGTAEVRKIFTRSAFKAKKVEAELKEKTAKAKK